MTTRQQQNYPWYIELRKHLIDPFFKSQKTGSIGRMFSTITFCICCYYWLSRTGSANHEAPASLLQVFFWTTGYVFANKVVHTTSKHISSYQNATVPPIPSINSFGHGATPPIPTTKQAAAKGNKTPKKAVPTVPTEDSQEPEDAADQDNNDTDDKASQTAQASSDTVIDSDAG